jgi:conjugal transfer pilus assembly protein TraV
LFIKVKILAFSTLAISLLTVSGCSSVFNPVGGSQYACPGMPMGVICKTPAAVYKSTNEDIEATDFDTPIGSAPRANANANASAMSSPSAETKGLAVRSFAAPKQSLGPKPIREPAQVVRIWIAPWVDKQDNLHLAETQYTEVRPRTWTTGKPESTGSSGYVIPHKAFDAIQASGDTKNARVEAAASEGVMPSGNSRNYREAAELVPPPY